MEDHKIVMLQDELRAERRKHKAALREINRLHKDIAAYEAVSVPPSKRVIRMSRGSVKASQATAIVMASDWHVDELVKPSTVQGRNKYNPDVAKIRSQRFWNKLVMLVERNRHDTKIENLVLILGGDFISGNIHEELLESTAMRPMEAILFVQDLLDAGIRYVKANGNFKKIVVVCKDGNHGRINQKIRHQTRTGNSLEWAMYQNLAKHHEDVEWVIEDSYLTYYKVYSEVLRIHHGDAIRYAGGVGGLEIPMKRAYYQWNMTEPASINFMGHYHSYMPGYNTVNGSLIGYNAYAAKNKFAFQPPMQTFVLLDARLGITVHSPILV